MFTSLVDTEESQLGDRELVRWRNHSMLLRIAPSLAVEMLSAAEESIYMKCHDGCGSKNASFPLTLGRLSFISADTTVVFSLIYNTRICVL